MAPPLRLPPRVKPEHASAPLIVVITAGCPAVGSGGAAGRFEAAYVAPLQWRTRVGEGHAGVAARRNGAGACVCFTCLDGIEALLTAPVVSVSLGLSAVFLFGGDARAIAPERIPLVHGDVVVWGGPARLRYHGVLPIKPGEHPLLGARRINLTFRRVR